MLMSIAGYSIVSYARVEEPIQEVMIDTKTDPHFNFLQEEIISEQIYVGFPRLPNNKLEAEKASFC